MDVFPSCFVGDGNITGKFELVYDESEENTDNREEDNEV